MSGFRPPLGGIGAQRPASAPANVRPASAPRPAASPGFDEEAVRRLEGLKRRHSQFRDMKIRLQGDRDRMRQDHEAACADAKAEFGTDDVAALDDITAKGQEEAATALDAFQATLDDIEARLNEAATVA